MPPPEAPTPRTLRLRDARHSTEGATPWRQPERAGRAVRGRRPKAPATLPNHGGRRAHVGRGPKIQSARRKSKGAARRLGPTSNRSTNASPSTPQSARRPQRYLCDCEYDRPTTAGRRARGRVTRGLPAAIVPRFRLVSASLTTSGFEAASRPLALPCPTPRRRCARGCARTASRAPAFLGRPRGGFVHDLAPRHRRSPSSSHFDAFFGDLSSQVILERRGS